MSQGTRLDKETAASVIEARDSGQSDKSIFKNLRSQRVSKDDAAYFIWLSYHPEYRKRFRPKKEEYKKYIYESGFPLRNTLLVASGIIVLAAIYSTGIFTPQSSEQKKESLSGTYEFCIDVDTNKPLEYLLDIQVPKDKKGSRMSLVKHALEAAYKKGQEGQFGLYRQKDGSYQANPNCP